MVIPARMIKQSHQGLVEDEGQEYLEKNESTSARMNIMIRAIRVIDEKLKDTIIKIGLEMGET